MDPDSLGKHELGINGIWSPHSDTGVTRASQTAILIHMFMIWEHTYNANAMTLFGTKPMLGTLGSLVTISRCLTNLTLQNVSYSSQLSH